MSRLGPRRPPDSSPELMSAAVDRRGVVSPSEDSDDGFSSDRSYNNKVPALAALKPNPGPPGYRSQRHPMPSPLSTTSNATSGPTSPSPLRAGFSQRRGNRPVPEPLPVSGQDDEAEHTTFYSDSSNPPSPDLESPRPNLTHPSNDLRSVSDPIIKQPGPGSTKPKKSQMADPVAAVAKVEGGEGLPRNSSIDSAISSMSTKSQAQSSSHDKQGPPDIANLLRTLGSPEAVIQQLIKEKQSQSQQNSQLWRLVDKQRAMILGLNKDLEKALKDKEKYRKKLKEVIENPAVSKVAGIATNSSSRSASVTQKTAVGTSEQASQVIESPTLDSDSPKNSPVEPALAPYPITPPADQPNRSPTTTGEMSGLRFRDLRDLPPNTSLPPSRSLPSEPPSVPPPKPPGAPPASPPILTIVEASPQPDSSLGKFPSPPPRKAPPAPLQLNKDKMARTFQEDEDSESDYDDILEVDEILGDESRGRRRTREEDERERDILVQKETEARSASKRSKSSKSAQESDSAAQIPSGLQAIPPTQLEAGTSSLDAVLSGKKPLHMFPPALSPGLPASPRPMNHNGPASPALSPRTMASFPAAPLSPRPPRQPIPLPANTPLATSGTDMSVKPLNVAKKEPEQPHRTGSGSSNKLARAEKHGIYTGFATEEYPDFLLPPNALPSIEVRVASSRMKPSRASLMSLTQLEEDPVFTLAVLSRSDRTELWRVEKDTVSLSKLDQRLKQCPAFTAKTPDRALFSGHAPAKLDARRVVLDVYMDELLDTPLDTATAVEFCKYLSTNVLPPNADETGSPVGPGPSDSSGHKLGPDGRPIRNGYLTKKGKNFGGWKARFFVLDGPLLKYYETPGGAHLGTIKLQGAQIGKQSQTNDNHSPSRGHGEDLDDQYRHAFLILEPKKKDSSSHVKHVLCAESDKERDYWVDALLQWIDYREPEDGETSHSRPGPPDRQASITSDSQHSVNKIRKAGQPTVRHQTADSDTLIGVRYDSVEAGDKPQVVTSIRPKTSGGLPESTASMQAASGDVPMPQSAKLISGPKDGQIISDSAAWGNKAGLPAPSHDEKKQRKRSFFGFGPKARSSSEGQDGAPGHIDGVPGATSGGQNSYPGPVRQVFGAPLAEAVRYNAPLDVQVPLPSVVYRCIQYLDERNAVLEEGIFRLSGSNLVIRQLRERFNTEGDVNLITDEQCYDIHAVASLLKLYLRELPTTILTRDLHLDFLGTTEITDRTEKVAALNQLAQRLPLANATLLKYLIAFLIKIINNADVNKMTVRNVGIVFSPTLNIPAPVFAMFLQNYEAVFGVEPDQYELPSPVTESEVRERSDHPPRFEMPPRPSTSSGSASASPHGQPRLDSMRDYQRSTPTPPLMGNPNAARSSPTPPVGTSRQVQESPTSGDSWPTYDTGRGSPAGYDGQGYQPPSRGPPGGHQGLRQQPSQEDYNNGPNNYDQFYGSNSRRRESAIFMGGSKGVQPQGSRSRLREETRL